MERPEFALLIDHTLLKPEATVEQVQALLDEAATLGTYSVCVSPSTRRRLATAPIPRPYATKTASAP